MGKLHHYLRYIDIDNRPRAELIREKRDVVGRRFNTYAACWAHVDSVLNAKQRRISLVVTEGMLNDGAGSWQKHSFDDKKNDNQNS